MAEANLQSDMAALSLRKCVQAVLDCDLCEDTTDINWRCVTCPANICAKCKANHESRSTFKRHKIIPRSSNRSLSPSNEADRNQGQTDGHLLSSSGIQRHQRQTDGHSSPSSGIQRHQGQIDEHSSPSSGIQRHQRQTDGHSSPSNGIQRHQGQTDEHSSPSRQLSHNNVRHLKDIAIACNKMAEIHHNGFQTMLECHKDSKWYILMVDEDGITINQRKFDFEAHGFAVSPRETLFVCDVHNCLVWKASPNGDIKPFLDTSPDKPWGVCLNSNGNIVVCLKTSVVVFSKDSGQKIRMVANTDSRGNQIFHWAYKIFQDRNMQYRLLDWEERSVLGFGGFFNLKWKYKTRQTRSVEALAICGDAFQNVLIGYYSGTVEILDSSGNFLMLFRISTSTCPQQISVDDHNLLWVVKEYERKISIFQYMY